MKAQRKTSTTKNNKFKINILAGSLLAVVSVAALASSHREAPSITTTPKADGTDFYMFRSYETNRSNFITLIANYQPLQDGYGGPNYFSMDPNALYEIHIDNDGDAQEEITFQFNFRNNLRDLSQMIGTESVSIPLIQQGPVNTVGSSNLNVADVLNVTFGIDKWISGIVMTVLVGFVLIGGVKRIGAVAQKVVPFMCVAYIIASVIILGSR